MVELYHCPSYVSLLPPILLHEIGIEHRLIFVDRYAGAHKREPYLKLNPNGLIPVLKDGNLLLYEDLAAFGGQASRCTVGTATRNG